MTQKAPSRRGFWMAQMFVVGILLFIGIRFSRSLDPEGREAATGPGKRAAAPASSPGAPRAALLPSPGGTPPLRPGGEDRRELPPAAPNADRRAQESGPYNPTAYRTWVSRDEESYKVWDLDPAELGWLRANRRQILLADLDTRPEPEGGLRITGVRSGSFASYRGLRVGDRLEEINGQSLDGPTDLVDLIEDPAQSGALGWRIQLKREGKPLTIDYRTAPGLVTHTRQH